MTRSRSVVIVLAALSLAFCSCQSSNSKPSAQAAAISDRQTPPPAPSVDTKQEPSANVPPGPQLYLLAATPTDDYGYPVTLYVAENGNLRSVRNVLPQEEGVRAVRAWGNAIFLNHPVVVPTAVTVLHTDDPLRVDDVTVQPDNPQFFFIASAVIAEPKPAELDEIMLSTPGELTPANIKWLSISSEPTTAESRVKQDSQNEYAAMRFEGQRPCRDFAALAAAVEGTNLVFMAFDHHVAMDGVSPLVSEAISQTARAKGKHYRGQRTISAFATGLLTGGTVFEEAQQRNRNNAFPPRSCY